MKTNLVMIILSALILTACGGRSGQNATSTEGTAEETYVRKIFPIEHGIIQQKMKVMGMETTPTIYFDKWGTWQATESRMEMTILNTTEVTHTLIINKDPDNWEIDLVKKTGIKGTKYFQNAMGFNPDDFASAKEQMKKHGMDAEQLADTVILGYTCKKFHVTSKEWGLDMYYATWGNVVMKMYGVAVGMPSTLEVTQIETIVPPAEKFEVPEGIVITEAKKY